MKVRVTIEIGGVAMNIDQYTEKAREELHHASKIAQSKGQPQIDLEHLLFALLSQEPGLALSILRKANVNVEALQKRCEQEIDRLPKVSGANQDGNVYLHPGLTIFSTFPRRKPKNSRTISSPSSTFFWRCWRTMVSWANCSRSLELPVTA